MKKKNILKSLTVAGLVLTMAAHTVTSVYATEVTETTEVGSVLEEAPIYSVKPVYYESRERVGIEISTTGLKEVKYIKYNVYNANGELKKSEGSYTSEGSSTDIINLKLSDFADGDYTVKIVDGKTKEELATTTFKVEDYLAIAPYDQNSTYSLKPTFLSDQSGIKLELMVTHPLSGKVVFYDIYNSKGELKNERVKEISLNTGVTTYHNDIYNFHVKYEDDTYTLKVVDRSKKELTSLTFIVKDGKILDMTTPSGTVVQPELTESSSVEEKTTVDDVKPKTSEKETQTPPKEMVSEGTTSSKTDDSKMLETIPENSLTQDPKKLEKSPLLPRIQSEKGKEVIDSVISKENQSAEEKRSQSTVTENTVTSETQTPKKEEPVVTKKSAVQTTATPNKGVRNLPKTGEESTFISLVGVAILGLLGIGLRTRQEK